MTRARNNRRSLQPALVAAAPSVAFRFVVVAVLVVGAAWLLLELQSILILVFLALILAAGALGPVRALEDRGLARPIAVVLVYLAVFAGLVLAFVLILPPLIMQLVALATDLPARLRSLVEDYAPLLQRLGLPTDPSALANLAGEQLAPVASSLPGIPLTIASILANTAAMVFLSALMLLERSTARDWLLRFVADDDRSTVTELAEKALHRLGAFVRGQLFIMTVTGTGSAIGLTLLGVPFALPLGLLAFVTEAIPLAGPILAGSVMIAVAFLESPAQALGTLILIIALQQLEGLVLVPVVQGRVISISPAVALVAVLSGSAVAGILGALIAIPIVAIATVVVEDVVVPWRQRQIDRGEAPTSAPRATSPPARTDVTAPQPAAARADGKPRRTQTDPRSVG